MVRPRDGVPEQPHGGRLPDGLVEAVREACLLGLHIPGEATGPDAWSVGDGDSAWAQIHPIIESGR